MDTLLTQLEAKFDEMSSQVLDKSKVGHRYRKKDPALTYERNPVTTMSTRVDALEVAIQDLINDTHVTPLPTPGPSSLSRSESSGTVKSVEQTD